MSNVLLICPDKRNGICLVAGCDGVLSNPRQSGQMDENCNPLYTGTCTFGGRYQPFHGLRPEADVAVTENPVTPIKNPVTPDQCPIEPLPTDVEFQKKLYCKRFRVSKDFKYIYDSVHTRKCYPNIQNLEDAGNKVISILRKLFAAYGKKSTDGWVYSEGGAWGPHFGKAPYSLFKSQQISVRKNPETNKSEWRIIPLEEFDEESPIGLHSKRKKHSNQKNNF